MIQRTFPLRILVQTDMVGAIIGRSGSTIKSITQETKARIDVHRKEGPDQLEKVITITGAPDNCSEACYRIIEIIQNEKSAKYDGHSPNNRDITLKMLAPNNLIARLIGRGGVTIKRMMEQTSTKISISMNNITESTGEHTITVIGRLEQVLEAEKLISSKLRAAYTSDVNNSLQSMNQQPYLFNNVPLPYMPNPYAQTSILSSIVGPQSGHTNNNNTTVSRNLTMGSHQAHLPAPGVYPGAPGYLPIYPNINLPQAAPGLLGFNPVGLEIEKETVHIYIPSTMVGAIIGKSGSAIKEMIHTSGANIKVTTAPPVPLETTTNQTDDQEGETTDFNEDDKAQKSEPTESNSKEEAKNDVQENSESPSSSGPVGEAEPSTGPMRTPRKQHSNTQNDCQTLASLRKVTVVGYPASQYSAQCLIYRKISMEAGEGDISLMVEINVPSQYVGRIIGKGGSTVKQLQKATGTLIRLPDDKNGLSRPGAMNDNAETSTNIPETTVQITGKFEGSQTAQRHIRCLIRESPHSRHNTKTQTNRHEENNVAPANNNNAQIDSSSISNSHLNDNRNDDDSTPSDLNDKSTSLSSSSEATTAAGTTHEKQGTDNNNLNFSECNPPRIGSTNNKRELAEEKSQESPVSESSPVSNGDNDKADVVVRQQQQEQPNENLVSNNNTINDNLNSSKITVTDGASIKSKDHHKEDTSKRNELVENGESFVQVHN